MLDTETSLLLDYKQFICDNVSYVKANNILPSNPQKLADFVTIVFREANNTDYNMGKTTNYQEYIDNLLYQVDIYAKDLVLDGQVVPARMIIIELRALTSKFFRELGFTRNSDIKNDYLERNVYKRTMTFSGKKNSWNNEII